MPFFPDVVMLGQFPLAVGALTGLLGGVLAYLLAGWLARRGGASPDGAQDLVLNLLVGGVLAAKLVYVALDPGGYLSNPLTLILFPYGPLALPAGAVGATAAGAWTLWRRADRLSILDQVTPALAVGLALAAAGLKGPGAWAFFPLLGAAALGSLATRRAAPTVVMVAAALALADLARPAAGTFGGVSGLQVAAVLTGTAAWLWTRRSA